VAAQPGSAADRFAREIVAILAPSDAARSRRLMHNPLDACPAQNPQKVHMRDDMRSRLKAIDRAVLTEVVRQDQRDPSFEITEWSVQQLSDKGMINPEGLWLFSGQGRAGEATQPWSVVLKILVRPKQEPPPDNLWYWKREILLAQSRLLERLPGSVRAPRFYRTEEYPDSAWLWMEHIVERQSRPWSLAQYAFAAGQLGQWNGACLAAMPLAEAPWLARRHYVAWLSWMNVETDWQFPLNQTHVSVELRRRYEQLWAERERFYQVLEGLPQVFSHFDSQTRNLFISAGQDGQVELVAVDWAMCGLGPLGADLNGLVADNGYMLEWPPAELPKLEAIAFPSYLHGLQQAGWTGASEVVRLGYVAWRAVYYGLIFSGLYGVVLCRGAPARCYADLWPG